MNTVNRRAAGSFQISESAARKSGAVPSFAALPNRPACRSNRNVAITVSVTIASASPLATTIKRSKENGSISALTAKEELTIPATIMIHVTAAAAARRSGATPEASSASADVPPAPTPAPIRL